jgi:uncharacterized protein (TIGR03435 family)
MGYLMTRRWKPANGSRPAGRYAVVPALAMTLALAWVRGASPQSRPAPAIPRDPIAFAVASVKPNKTGELLIRTDTLPGGRFIAQNVPVSTLVRLAFRVQGYQISGAPSWFETDRFDLDARAGIELPPLAGPLDASGPVPQMVQALLADRFRMVAHRETRDGAAFRLTRVDGTAGARLTPARIDCVGAAVAAPREVVQGCTTRISPGTIVMEGTPIAKLAGVLSGLVGRPVIDETGLTGAFDIEIQWQPPPTPGAPGAPAASTDGGSLFTAIREQLGLKLDAARAPIEALVIDRLERPTPN